MPSPHWLQSQVLQRLLLREPVEVVQVNGERMRGVVAGFGTYSNLFKTVDGNACFFFKHGISAIHGGNALLKRRQTDGV